jgi:hypothetical protein
MPSPNDVSDSEITFPPLPQLSGNLDSVLRFHENPVHRHSTKLHLASVCVFLRVSADGVAIGERAVSAAQVHQPESLAIAHDGGMSSGTARFVNNHVTYA